MPPIPTSGRIVAAYMVMLLPRTTTRPASTAMVPAARNRWLTTLPGSQHSHGIRPQAPLTSTWLTTKSTNQPSGVPRVSPYRSQADIMEAQIVTVTTRMTGSIKVRADGTCPTAP